MDSLPNEMINYIYTFISSLADSVRFALTCSLTYYLRPIALIAISTLRQVCKQITTTKYIYVDDQSFNGTRICASLRTTNGIPVLYRIYCKTYESIYRKGIRTISIFAGKLVVYCDDSILVESDNGVSNNIKFVDGSQYCSTKKTTMSDSKYLWKY